MSFRLVPKSVTLNELERRNGRFCVISATSVAFRAHRVKVVEDIPKLSATEIYSRELLVCSDKLHMAIFAVDHPQRRR